MQETHWQRKPRADVTLCLSLMWRVRLEVVVNELSHLLHGNFFKVCTTRQWKKQPHSATKILVCKNKGTWWWIIFCIFLKKLFCEWEHDDTLCGGRTVGWPSRVVQPCGWCTLHALCTGRGTAHTSSLRASSSSPFLHVLYLHPSSPPLQSSPRRTGNVGRKQLDMKALPV